MAREKVEEEENVEKEKDWIGKFARFFYGFIFISIAMMLVVVSTIIKADKTVVLSPSDIKIEKSDHGDQYVSYYFKNDSLGQKAKKLKEKNNDRSIEIRYGSLGGGLEEKIMKKLGKPYFAEVEGDYMKISQRVRRDTDVSQYISFNLSSEEDNNSLDDVIDSMVDMRDIRIVIKDNSIVTIKEIIEFVVNIGKFP